MPAPPLTTVVVDQYGYVVTVPAAVTTGVVISGGGPQGPPGIDGSLAAAKIPDWAANTTVQANEVRRLPDGSLGRWIGATGTTGAAFNSANWTPLATASTTIKADSYVNQVVYATVYDALQAALDAAVTATATAPVTLEFGARVYDLNKGTTFATGGQYLKLADGLTNWLRITGLGNARIKLGAGTPGFIGPKSVAPGKTYGKVQIDGFTFDANNVTAASHGIIVDFNSNDYNLDGFHIHDCVGINAGPLVNGSGRRWINLTISTSVAFDIANPRILNNITLERLDLTGSNGNLISGFATTLPSDNQFYGKTVTAANITLDNILVRDVKWDSQSVFYGSIGSAGMQIGGDGLSLNIIVEDSVFKNGGDVGVELGGVVNAVVRNVICENFTNDAFFISNNHGGLPIPEQQHVIFDNCTAIASESRMSGPMAGFALQSNHESKFGHIEFTNCTYKHTAPTFLQSGNGQITSSPGSPFLLYGSWRKLSIRNCNVVFSNLNFVFTATTGSFTPVIVDVICSGDASILEVKDMTVGYQGQIDNSAAVAGAAMQVDGMRLRGTRIWYDIDGFHWWSNVAKIGTPTPAVRFRDILFNPTTGFADTFSSNALLEDYVVDAGSITDVLATSIPVTSVANHTVRKLFKAPSMPNAATGLMSQIGRVLDGSTYAEATVPTTTPQGFELIARLRVSDNGQSGLRAIIDDDGTNSRIRIEKAVAGVVTVLVGPTNLAARMTAGSTVGIRLTQRGDLLTADHYTGTAGRTVNTVGTNRVTYTLTSAAERIFRGTGAPGYAGFGWTPGDATSTLIRYHYDSMGVISGRVRGLSPLEHLQDVNVSNAIIGGDSTRIRVENPPIRMSWDRASTALHGPAEFNGPDATFKSQVLVEQGSTWGAPPVPALLTVGASPYTYINQDGYIQDIAIYGGTLTTPFVEISKDGGVTFNQIAGSSVEKMVRLAPADQVRVTYSVAPTMRKIPVL